jgi:hypothetical protein
MNKSSKDYGETVVTVPKEVTTTPATASVGRDFFIRNAKHLVTILGFFIKHPAKLALSYHKQHMGILLRMVDSIHKGKAIRSQILEIQQTLDAFKKQVHLLVGKIREIPKHPLGDAQALFTILMYPYFRQTPGFVKSFNNNLKKYEEVLQSALDSCSAYAETGRNIETETLTIVNKITDEIKKMGKSWNLDVILQEAYLKKLEWIRLDLMTDVQEARSKAEEQVRYLHGLMKEARDIEPLKAP